MTSAEQEAQLPLLGVSGGAPKASTGSAARSRPRSPRSTGQVAVDRPVARVAVLTPLPHLDRPLDYAVPESLAEQAQPGVRVRVRLAGRLVDGFILDRVDAPETERVLQPLRSVHGPPVLTSAIARLCREVADRYAGTFADVVRAAVPPRHARVEVRVLAQAPPPTLPDLPPTPVVVDDEPFAPDPSGWAAYRGGRQLLAAVADRKGPRVSWCSGPGEDVPPRIAELARLTVESGGGVLIVVPDAADVIRYVQALRLLGLSVVDLTARTGPQARYRAFLRVLLAEVRVVVGTRAAVFSPVRDLSLVVVIDDADDALAEPHAPGWHAREVAALRAGQEGAGLVLAGPSVSLEAERMVALGWLGHVELPRSTLRARSPRIEAVEQAAGRDPARAAARIPSVALEVLREAAERGPVLVSVPRAGYLPALLCQTCREQVVCPQCAVPLGSEGPGSALLCPQHGRLAWTCPHCGGSTLRAAVVGVRRTAEEFGRALPGIPVISSSAGGGIVRSLTSPQGIVVATPGAEPDPGPAGYAGLVLLDVAAAMSRPGLRVAEQTLRRWLLAASLVRPAAQGGRVLVVGEAGLREVQALVRWDPRGYAQREIDERLALALPPAVRTARLTGPALEVAGVVEQLRADLGSRVRRCSGPLPPDGPSDADEDARTDDRATWILAVSPVDGPRLTRLVQQVQARRSVRRAPVVAIRMDLTSG